MATTFDTLRAAKRLKGLGFNEEQAEGVAELVRDSRELDFSDLATKADVAAIRADLAHFATKAGLAETKAEIIKWVFGVGLAQALALIGGVFTLLKLFPGVAP